MLDFHVSFGTGRLLAADQGGSHNWTKYLFPEWIRRVKSCVRAAVDADAMYEKFWNTLDKAEQDGKHYRIDPEIATQSLAPDDPTALSELETETMRYMGLPDTKAKTRRLRLAMLASCFFCTLLSLPRYDPVLGQYRVRLAIQSRWPEDDTISQSLHSTLETASFVVGGIAYPYKSPLACLNYVDSLDVSLHITLTLDGKESHPISGFPLTLKQMMYLQLPLSTMPATSPKRGGPCLVSGRLKRRCLEWPVLGEPGKSAWVT
ncbi:hypothetical protein PENSUB_9542 [Penicillium subrubescens]|uniref:Uncharacterized protein n=1 Tax=Penicillium subrubescens TaxID=1316194 RepID=A0A1Q5TD08_9EURO|nr:hypothetical protein PENSUB_9542 [Penicillium subrubescens]